MLPSAKTRILVVGRLHACPLLVNSRYKLRKCIPQYRFSGFLKATFPTVCTGAARDKGEEKTILYSFSVSARSVQDEEDFMRRLSEERRGNGGRRRRGKRKTSSRNSSPPPFPLPFSLLI